MAARNTSSAGKKRRMKLTDAAAYLGVSQSKISRLIRDGELTYSDDVLDRRRKLVLVEDLNRIKEQSLLSEKDD